YEWTIRDVLPALEREGIIKRDEEGHLTQESKADVNVELTKIASNPNVAAILSEMISNQPLIEKELRRREQTLAVDQVNAERLKTLSGATSAAGGAFKELGTRVGRKGTSFAARGMMGLSNSLEEIMKAGEEGGASGAVRRFLELEIEGLISTPARGI